jgi:hypothetical protein
MEKKTTCHHPSLTIARPTDARIWSFETFVFFFESPNDVKKALEWFCRVGYD